MVNDVNMEMHKLYHLGYWGIALATISSLFFASGFTIQKIIINTTHRRKYHINSSLSNDINIKGYGILSDENDDEMMRSMRLAGYAYILIGILLRLITDVLLPLSTISALSSLTIVVSYILESVFLASSSFQGSASSSQRQWSLLIGLILLIFGILLCLHGGNYIDGIYNLHDLSRLFSRSLCIYLTIACLVIIFILRRYQSMKILYTNHTFEIIYLSFTSACYASGLNIFTKAIFEVIKYSMIQGQMMGNILSWEILGYTSLAVALALGKLMYVGYGMTTYHPMLFLPAYHVSLVSVSLINRSDDDDDVYIY